MKMQVTDYLIKPFGSLNVRKKHL